MPLERLRIEGFRGVRSLDLALDATTALIGENNAGKTSVLDALSLALGTPGGAPPSLRREDFHVPPEPGAPPVPELSLSFSFREPEKGAWDEEPWLPLRAAASASDLAGRRRLTVALTAALPSPGALAEGRVTVLDAWDRPLAPAPSEPVVAAVRQRYPVLRLRPGQPSAGLAPRTRATDAPGQEPPTDTVARLERLVGTAYRRIATTWRPLPGELHDALSVVRELAHRYEERIAAGPAAEAGRTIASIAETPSGLGAGSPLSPGPPGQGRGVQNVALLAAIGSFLEARGESPLLPGAEPIVVIEDAEARLHPILLASVWRVIDRIPAQKVVTTNSGDLLASVPLHSIRRLVRRPSGIEAHGVGAKALTVDEARRIAFHVRLNRASALFARCWVLVEGETEAWLLPELAHVLRYDFPAEGIRCVEFAQCGAAALLRLARELGIEWHLLADGDMAGRAYAATARAHLEGQDERDRLTSLRALDVEHLLFACGYASIYRRAAFGEGPAPSPAARSRERPTRVIRQALQRHAKPRMVLEVAEAAAAPGSPGVPRVLASLIETAVRLARSAGS